MTEKSKGPGKKVKQPEGDFAEFYFGVISKLYDMKCRQISRDVQSALRNIRLMKREDNRNKQFSFSYKTPSMRCAYLYGYSVLHSVMIYSEFLKYLEINERYMMPTLQTVLLKICCMGGGPGFEALAICKSIKDFVLRHKSEESLLEVQVTVIDKLPHWKREETAVINAVNDKSNILHSERIILHSDFLKADILKPFEKSLKEKIKEADIVTIIKVASNIQEINAADCGEDLQTTIRNVIECMDDISCLFMLDNAGGNVFYNMRKVLQEAIGPSLLKKSDHKDYILDQSTGALLSGLMKYNNNSAHHPILPTVRGKVSSCMWIKNIVPGSENTEFSSKEDRKSSENSCSSYLQCKGNTAPDCKTECGVTPKSAITKVPPRKKKQKELKLKKDKYPDVLIISDIKPKKTFKKCAKVTCA